MNRQNRRRPRQNSVAAEVLESRSLLSAAGMSSVTAVYPVVSNQSENGAEAPVAVTVDQATSTVRLKGSLENADDVESFVFLAPAGIRVWQWSDTGSAPSVRRRQVPDADHAGGPEEEIIVDVRSSADFRKGGYEITLTLDDEPNRPAPPPAVTQWFDDPWRPMTVATATRRFEYAGDRDVTWIEIPNNVHLELGGREDLQFALTDEFGERHEVSRDVGGIDLSPGESGRRRWALEVSSATGRVGEYRVTARYGSLDVGTPGIRRWRPAVSVFDPAVLEWEANGPVDAYELYVVRKGFSKPIVHLRDLQATRYQLPEHLPSGEYRYWVRSRRFRDRFSAWSGVHTVSSRSAELPPAILNGASGLMRPPELQDADFYEIQAIDEKTGTVIHEFRTTGGPVPLPGEVPAGPVRLRMRAGQDGDVPRFREWNTSQVYNLYPPSPTPDITAYYMPENPASTVSGATEYLEDFIRGDRLVLITGSDRYPSQAKLPGFPPGLFEDRFFLSAISGTQIDREIDLLGQVSGRDIEFRIVDSESGELLATEEEIRKRFLMYDIPYWHGETVRHPGLELDFSELRGRRIAISARTPARGGPWTKHVRASAWSEPLQLDLTEGMDSLQFSPGRQGSSGSLRWIAPPQQFRQELHLSWVESSTGGPLSFPYPVVAARYEIGQPQTTSVTGYEVWVNDGTTGQRAYLESGLEGLEWAFPSSAEPGRYYAWVRPRYSDGTSGEWSDPETVRLPSDAVEFQGLPEETADATPTLEWQGAQSDSTYEVWIRDESTGRRVHHRTGIRGEQYRVNQALSAGRYRLWVREHLRRGTWSLWGEGTELAIGAPPALQSEGLRVFWHPQRGSTHYEIRVDRSSRADGALLSQTTERVFRLDYEVTEPDSTSRYRIWVRAVRSEGGTHDYSEWASIRLSDSVGRLRGS